MMLHCFSFILEDFKTSLEDRSFSFTSSSVYLKFQAFPDNWPLIFKGVISEKAFFHRVWGYIQPERDDIT